jgi:signal transduction histidine kinase
MTTPSSPAAHGFDLLRWFSLVSFAVVAAVSAAQALLLSRHLEERLLRHDAEISRQLVQAIVDTQAVSRYFTQGEASGHRDAFAEFFSHLAAMPEVLRANVYATDGSVLWSSDPALIGRRFDHNEELEEALHGDTVVHRGEVRGDEPRPLKPEHIRLARTQTHFVESYLPVRDGGAAGVEAPIVGVVELYRLPGSLNATLRQSTLLVWACAALGGLLLYASTLGLVRKAARLLQEQRARMVEGEALALVGEIAASVAHSIRNPLACIRSGAELQAELGSAAPPEIAHETVQHADRIEHLLRTLLSHAHGAEELPGAADVAQALRGARERFEPVFAAQRKTLALELPAEELPWVRGEAVLIAQMLNSLLANALEATAEGDHVRLQAWRLPGSVVLEVTDSGRGIAPERLSQVFRPFHTDKPRGLGLGLALVRRTLQRLGGSIELESRPGHTTARVRLPAAQAVPER